tara:strand:+ start:843 stop:1964 length:1122 start_codon:yes stop_codon:yes gene_type:complete
MTSKKQNLINQIQRSKNVYDKFIGNSKQLSRDIIHSDIFKNQINRLKIYLKNINPTQLINILQDKLFQIVTISDENQVILKQPKFWARSITWLIMGTTGFGIGWLAVAKTDEIVIAVGKLEPVSGVIEVQMPMEGVTSKVLVAEGERVQKNQVLVQLDTQITDATNISLNKSLILNKSISEKLENLVKEGAVSELQYMQQLEKLEDIKSKIKTNKVRMSYQEILSPSDGFVFDIKPKGPGFVARTSEPILKIVPFDNLLAKVEIDSRKIGFVNTGKKVDISIDSFPATDFGVVEGVLESIGSDALPPIPAQQKGYRYPAKVTLNNQFLKLKSGQKLKLQTGMSLTANIKLRKVTYLQLLLNKFSDKADSLKSI